MGSSYYFSSKQKGFTLVEVIVAMALLAIIITFTSPLILHSYERIMWSRTESVSIYEKQRNLETKIDDNDISGTGSAVINSGAPISVDIFQEGSLIYFRKEQ